MAIFTAEELIGRKVTVYYEIVPNYSSISFDTGVILHIESERKILVRLDTTGADEYFRQEMLELLQE